MITLDKRLDAKIIEALKVTAPDGENCEGGINDPLFNTLIYRNILKSFARTATGLEQRMYLTAIMYGYKVIDNSKYLVKVPNTKDYYYYKGSVGLIALYKAKLDSALPADLFTVDDIKEYGLEDCEQIEFNGEVVQ